jgi:ribonuclease VapC
MIVDTSAIVAMLLDEAESGSFVRQVGLSRNPLLPAPNHVETLMVLVGRRGDTAASNLEQFLSETGISILPFTADHALAAREAYLRFGKGRHPAALNFGDCMAYAAAKVERMPLLFKGSDFALTDVEVA